MQMTPKGTQTSFIGQKPQIWDDDDEEPVYPPTPLKCYLLVQNSSLSPI